MTRPTFLLALLSALLMTLPAARAAAEIRPNEVAILANRNSADSVALARYYAARRGIPPEQIVQLELPVDETISRKDYEERLVLPLRRALESGHLATRIRVLATTYGIPLRVDAPLPNESEQRWITDATERQRFARGYLAQIAEWAARIAPSVSVPPGPPTPPAASMVDENVKLLDEVHRAIEAAVLRVNSGSSSSDTGIVEQWKKELSRVILQAGGTAGLVQRLQGDSRSWPGTQANLETMRRQVVNAEAAIRILASVPSDSNRKQAYVIAERIFGLEGILRLATGELEMYRYKDGDASVDSELALLWWDRVHYPVAGRFANPLFYGHAAFATPSITALPVLIVSRLDGPPPAVAKHLIDSALEAEQRGLAGKAYIDARGIQPDGTIGYGYYDQGLRDLADLLSKRSPYPVVLENTERRFSRRGEAPDVALYVGWYKLRAYEDAFTFNPGAIGYHIASGEAVSIHDANETGWCKNALERGITATLGPVGEPYIEAFPLPSEFIPLLLTGHFTLAEAYTLTSRYVSWRMVLFGDPLYNPWRGRAVLQKDETVLKKVRSRLGQLPIAPFALPFSDPLKARDDVGRQQRTALAQALAFAKELERRPGKPRH